VRETQKQPFQLSFNSCLRVEFQGAQVTSDGGLILVRELDERLGLSALMQRHDQFASGQERAVAVSDLLRQSIYSRLADYEDVNDAERCPRIRPLLRTRLPSGGLSCRFIKRGWVHPTILGPDSHRVYYKTTCSRNSNRVFSQRYFQGRQGATFASGGPQHLNEIAFPTIER
jgi:hypothetical protein